MQLLAYLQTLFWDFNTSLYFNIQKNRTHNDIIFIDASKEFEKKEKIKITLQMSI